MLISTMRQWPQCEQPMWDVVGHLTALGASDDALEAALRRDFPGLVPDTIYGNVLHIEKMRLYKTPSRRQVLEPEELAVRDEKQESRNCAARALLAELALRNCRVVRDGEGVYVGVLDESAPVCKLPETLKAQVRELSVELWELVSGVRS